MTRFETIGKTLFYLIVGGVWLIGALEFHTPEWAIWSSLGILAAIFFEMHNIKGKLTQILHQIMCELNGHGAPEFKRKYDDTAYCPRCKDAIASRAPESNGPGRQLCEDTLHQRICRLEAALGVEE